MTRARTLKTAIRARMSKTGERYTVARRHVLATREAPSAGAATAPASRRPTSAPPSRPPASPPAHGAVADAKVLERTGHDLAYWFGVLDAFDAVRQGHTAAARHLREQHGVDGWYSQGITVAYERARGVRAVNQRVDGKFGASVSITVLLAAADVAAWLTSPRRRTRWTAPLDAALARLLAAAVKGTAPKGLWLHSSGQYRCRHRWADGVFQLMLMPKSGDRTTILVEHSLVSTRASVENYRRQWRAALTALANVLPSTRRTRRQ